MLLNTRKSSFLDYDVVILYDQLTERPLLLPLLYSSLSVYNKSNSTQKSHISSIKFFYMYWESKFNINFDDYLFDSDFDFNLVINNLSSFSIWLSKNNITKSVDIRIRNIGIYLRWVVDRYFTKEYLNCEARQATSLSIEIKKSVTISVKHITGGYGRNGSFNARFSEFKSFNQQTEIAIKSLIVPSTARVFNIHNPWKDKHVQIRNYLMCSLMLECGLRIGEVLNLTTLSIYPNVDRNAYYLVVDKAEDHPLKDKPGIKNYCARRTIAISNNLAAMLLNYIKEIRPLPYPAHNILFVSSRKGAKPLSIHTPRAITNSIFKKLTEVFHLLVDDGAIDSIDNLTPHYFRHTWAVNAMEFFIEEKKYDMNKAVEMLRKIGGWSIDSNMPLLYSNRYIAEKAGRLNKERMQNSMILEALF